MQDKIKTRRIAGNPLGTGQNSHRAALKRDRERIRNKKAALFGLIFAAVLSLSVLRNFSLSVHAAANSGTAVPISTFPKDDGTASLTPRVDNLLLAQPVLVLLADGGAMPRSLTTLGRTVSDALVDANIHLGPYDLVTPARTEPILPGLKIAIKRVRFEHQGEKYPIPFRTVFKMSSDVQPGQIARGHIGSPGLVFKVFEAKFVNEHLASKRLLSKSIIRQPVNQETLGGIRTRMAQALPSRGGLYQRTRCLSMLATGYSPYEGSGSGRCATGMRAGYGVVAVDPRVIRLGSKLYIEGYGYAIAGDTGGAIKGHRIDLGHTTHSEASHVGRHRVTVWVLSSSD